MTSTLAYEGAAQVVEYAGGYDWQKQRAADRADTSTEPSGGKKKGAKPKTKKTVRLGFNETRELAALPARIEQLEQKQSELQGKLSDPHFYQGDKSAIADTTSKLSEITVELEQAYARWEQLEELASSGR